MLMKCQMPSNEYLLLFAFWVVSFLDLRQLLLALRILLHLVALLPRLRRSLRPVTLWTLRNESNDVSRFSVHLQVSTAIVRPRCEVIVFQLR